MRHPVAIVYPPPIPGTPFLAVIFRDGRVVYCESVETREKAKALLEAVAEEMLLQRRGARREPE